MSLSRNDIKNLRDILERMDDNKDINKVREIYQKSFGAIQRKKASKFKIGQRVIIDTKNGKMTGNVVRVNDADILVGADTGTVWRVQPSAIDEIAA